MYILPIHTGFVVHVALAWQVTSKESLVLYPSLHKSVIDLPNSVFSPPLSMSANSGAVKVGHVFMVQVGLGLHVASTPQVTSR